LSSHHRPYQKNVRRRRALGCRRLALAAFLMSSCGGVRPGTTPGPGTDAASPNDHPLSVVDAALAAPATGVSSSADGARTAIDLVANRIQAVSHRQGRLVMDTGTPDFLKYIDGDWKTSWILGEKDQGRPAAMVATISSIFFFPLDTDGDGAGGGALSDTLLSFTGRSLAPKQRLSIFVNEKPITTLDIDEQTKRYDVTVPASACKLGDNRVRLTFRAAGTSAGGQRSAAAIHSISIGPAGLGPLVESAKPVAAQTIDLGGVKRAAVTLAGSQGGRLSYYLALPVGARLSLSYGSKAPGASVEVRVAVDGARPRVLHQGAAVADHWTDAIVDLGAAGGQAARIDLVSRGGDVAWGDPRVVVTAPVPPPLPHKTFDHLFVWMVDTLRADKVHVYNPQTRVQTPNYDDFAADATRFEWAQVPGTWSLPSHASLLTGVYPVVHKATAHEARLSADVPFVAEEMKKAGYKTALFSSNGYVSNKWGFDRGWDMYRNFIRENLPNSADYLWKIAKPWVLANQKHSEFAYLATVEPHVIYNPPKEFLIKYWNKPYHGPIKPTKTGVQLGLIKSGKLKINDNDKAYLEALHDGEITQSDAAFKVFVNDLKKAGLYDQSVVIVVSDHGDEFWEHGGEGHGHSVYQELTRVPLLIRAPGLLPPGHVVHSDVEIMDLFATMLELCGVRVPAQSEGTSLIPLVQDEVGRSPRAALTLDGTTARGLKVGRYRLIEAGKQELFDEIEDRREQHSVAADRPIALRQMRNVFGLLHAYEARWNKTRWGTAANVTPAFAHDVGL
jgi:hypothetical protein